MLGKIKGKEEAVASPSQGEEFEQALGDGEGQGSLACCSPWGLKGLDMTEPLNNNQLWETVEAREAWRATVHEAAKSWTWLSD